MLNELIINEIGLEYRPYGFIYITTNNINGMKYIGQKSFDTNWQWPKYLGSGTYFKRALKKYGRVNFSREIIALAYSKEEINEMEMAFIKNHNAVESKDYYNLSIGGVYSFSGFTMPEEDRKRIGESLKGRKLSEETKRRMSIAKSGKNHYNYGKQGIIMSEEHKQKLLKINTKLNQEIALEIREKYNVGNYTQRQLADEYNVKPTTIGRVIHYEGMYHLENIDETIIKKGKKTKIICITNGEIFNSIAEARDKYNIYSSSLSLCCSHKLDSAGKHPETGEKMVWMYYEEYIKLQTN